MQQRENSIVAPETSPASWATSGKRIAPAQVFLPTSGGARSGWEAARRLKADTATAKIPVIALTAHAMVQDKEKALAAGCDDFDTKPVEPPRLLEKINTLLRGGG